MSSNREQLLEGGGLSVRFRVREDRIAHDIWLAGTAAWVHVLTSLEGLPLHDWPASPPFQSLSLENRPGDRQLALLVGMAGKSHWSASVELDPAAACVIFDIACRTRGGRPRPLGSCYQALQPVCDETPRHAVFGSNAASPWRLGLELCERFGPAQLVLTAADVKVVPIVAPAGASSQTIRWGYKISRRGPDAGVGLS